MNQYASVCSSIECIYFSNLCKLLIITWKNLPIRANPKKNSIQIRLITGQLNFLSFGLKRTELCSVLWRGTCPDRSMCFCVTRSGVNIADMFCLETRMKYWARKLMFVSPRLSYNSNIEWLVLKSRCRSIFVTTTVECHVFRSSEQPPQIFVVLSSFANCLHV